MKIFLKYVKDTNSKFTKHLTQLVNKHLKKIAFTGNHTKVKITDMIFLLSKRKNLEEENI